MTLLPTLSCSKSRKMSSSKSSRSSASLYSRANSSRISTEIPLTFDSSSSAYLMSSSSSYSSCLAKIRSFYWESISRTTELLVSENDSSMRLKVESPFSHNSGCETCYFKPKMLVSPKSRAGLLEVMPLAIELRIPSCGVSNAT